MYHDQNKIVWLFYSELPGDLSLAENEWKSMGACTSTGTPQRFQVQTCNQQIPNVDILISISYIFIYPHKKNSIKHHRI